MSLVRRCMIAALLVCMGCAVDESSKSSIPNGPQKPGIPSQGRNFGQLRAIIASGEVPAPSVLSLDVFLDEHTLPTGKRLCAAPLCLNASHGMGPDLRTGIPRRWLAITLQPGTQRPAARADRLIIAVDTSSSMAGPPMDALRRALRPLANNAGATTLQLIGFGDEVVINAPVSALESADWQAQVDALEARGGSDLQAGLRAALQQALAEEVPARVLFVADGTSNTGITSEQRMMALARSYSAAGVELSTLGLGNDFPAQLLHGLQQSSLGSFYHVDDLGELGGALEREVGTRRVRLGSELTLSIAQSAAMVATYGAEASITERGVLQLQLIAAGVEQRAGQERARIASGANILLVELAATRVVQDEPAQLTLDYLGADARPTSDSVTLEGLQSWERAAMRGEWSDAGVERYATVISVHDALRSALEDYARGDARGAARGLTRFIAALEEWLRDRDEQDIYQDLLLLRQLADTIRLRAGSFE
jgi:hypothetical protein